MKANHFDLCTGAPRLQGTAPVAPAVLAWLVAALLLLGGAPPGHAQTDSEPALGTVDDLTLLRNQAVDTDRTTTAADPVVLHRFRCGRSSEGWSRVIQGRAERDLEGACERR